MGSNNEAATLPLVGSMVLIAEWILCATRRTNQLLLSNDIMASHTRGFEQQHMSET